MIEIAFKSCRYADDSSGSIIVTKRIYQLDEFKTDYEICFVNGIRLSQCSAFGQEAADWDESGEIYERFGAWFACAGHKQFYTPHQLVDLVAGGSATISGVMCKEVL